MFEERPYSNTGFLGVIMSTMGYIAAVILTSIVSEFFIHSDENGIQWHNTHWHINTAELSGLVLSFVISTIGIAYLFVLYYTRDKEHQNVVTLAEAKDDAFKVLSHELRTPLAGIIGIVDLIKDEFNDDPDKALYMKMLISSTEHMSLLINNVLCHNSIVRTQSINAQYSTFNICNLLRDVSITLQVMAHAKLKDVNVDYQCDSNATIECDETLLRQVLLNVGGNAVKFTNKGSVTITLLSLNDNECLISIADTGIGIKAQDFDKVFRAYTQIDNPNEIRKHNSTGLGMSITKKIIARLGGSIRLESEYNVGTTFYITFPIVKH